MNLTRRDLLRLMGSGTAAAFTTPLSFAQPSLVPDVEIELRAAAGEASILPGAATRVWKFTGRLIKGPPGSLQPVADSFLGPTLRLQTGQRVRVKFRNDLREPTIVHWHGIDMPAAMDGHPRLAIDPGSEFLYEFEVTNRAGTYWYHPHPHMRTGPQVYHGLAGMLLVSDDEESALKLPSGDEELLCVLQDRQFDSGNQLMYLPGGTMDQAHGFLGDRVLVNGRHQMPLALATRAYRLRVLNGSNARIYKLTWSDGTPVTLIGTDGGLLERARQQPFVTLAPAQRADIVLDLSRRTVGAILELRSAAFPATAVETMRMMGRRMGSGGRGRGMGAGMAAMQHAVPNGASLSVMTIRVARHEPSAFRMPERLSTFRGSWLREADVPQRRVTLGFEHGQWFIDGQTFDMLGTTMGETVKAGSTQIWEIVNAAGMMGMQAAHPIHLHGPQFRVMSRAGGSAAAQAVIEGAVGAGWLDTVLVMPGETVRIKVTFTRHTGLYLYHCHILEHEDMGMMRNFRVT